MSKFDESEMSYYRTHKVKQHYTMNHKNLYLNDGKEPIYRYKGLYAKQSNLKTPKCTRILPKYDFSKYQDSVATPMMAASLTPGPVSKFRNQQN